MALTHFISLPEAARRLRANEAEVRSMVASGKIDGGVLPDGMTMVVSENSLPQRKVDLPEYKKHAHLKGQPIWVSEASRKYDIPHGNLARWSKAGIIAILGRDGNKTLLDEADVAYCVEIHRQRHGSGKWLFNSDGTPYKPKAVAG